MSNDTDTVRVYFPATIPKRQVEALVSLLTGNDSDVLLDVERAVNERLYPVIDEGWNESVEFDAPVVFDVGPSRSDYVLLEDVIPEVTAR